MPPARKALLDTHDGSRSSAHRFVERILSEMRVSYMTECEEFRPYRLDIYLPEWHAALEIDGPGHTKKRDQFRDARLLDNYSVRTFRMRSDRIVKKADIQAWILRSIEAAAEDADERKRKYREWLASR